MERKNAEEIIRVFDEFKLDHAVAVRREVAVRKHHALGVTGGPGSVQESCENAVSGWGWKLGIRIGSKHFRER